MRRRSFLKMLGWLSATVAAAPVFGAQLPSAPVPKPKGRRLRLSREWANARYEIKFFTTPGCKELFPVIIDRNDPDVAKTLADYAKKDGWRMIRDSYPMRMNSLNDGKTFPILFPFEEF